MLFRPPVVPLVGLLIHLPRVSACGGIIAHRHVRADGFAICFQLVETSQHTLSVLVVVVWQGDVLFFRTPRGDNFFFPGPVRLATDTTDRRSTLILPVVRDAVVR